MSMSNKCLSWGVSSRFWVGVYLVLFICCAAACSGSVSGVTGGNGTGEDGTGDGSDDGTGSGGSSANPLYEAGPIDIPVPIAKVEAPNPGRITVTVSGSTVSLVGEEGALPDNASCSQVYTYDTLLELQQTATYRSGGRFDEIVFTYNGQSSITTSIIVACFDGTSIGSPIFLKIDEGSFVWLLTNGAEVSDGALSVYGDTVYLVSETDASTSVSKLGGAGRDSDCTGVESTLYSLAIGGNYEEVASGCFSIDQVLATEGGVIVRSGGTFYQPASGEFTEGCGLSLGSGESIKKVSVGYDVENSGIGINVGTNRALYSCNVYEGQMSASQFGSYFTLQSNWEITAIVTTDDTTSGRSLTVVYSVVDRSTGLPVSPTGGTIAAFDSFGAVTQSSLDSTGEGISPETELIAYGFTEGLSSNAYNGEYVNFKKRTEVSSGTAGSSSATVFTIWSDINSVYYLLDASLTTQANGTSSAGGTSYTVSKLLDVSKTRTVHHVQLHRSAYVTFFCADDSSGNGQLYAYCPTLLPRNGTPDGSEVIQLTTGVEHCDERNNWGVDTDSTDGPVVVVNLSNPETPQIRFIDPLSDPLLADCFP